jgi:hypothetical protein
MLAANRDRLARSILLGGDRYPDHVAPRFWQLR